MGMYIGDIYVPFVSEFSVDKLKKKTEVVKHCDSRVPAHLAEFQSDLRTAKLAGTLLQTAVKTVDQYAEDLQGAADRSAAYNFLHDFQSRTGWLSLADADIPKSAETTIRKYSLSGMFMPKSKYQPRFHTAPQIIANDFSLVLGSNGCDCYVPLPVGATYGGGDGSTISRTTKDGTVTLVKATTNNDVLFDLDADEVDVGECKVWDDMNEASEANWVRVFSPDHEFTDEMPIAENGLIRMQTYYHNLSIYGYVDSSWVTLFSWHHWWNMKSLRLSISPDEVNVNWYDFGTNSLYSRKVLRGFPGLIIKDDTGPYVSYSTHESRFLYTDSTI